MDLKRDLSPKLTRSVFDLNFAKIQITPAPSKKNLLSSALSFLIDQLVKNPPAMQETPVQFLSQEDLLEKG